MTSRPHIQRFAEILVLVALAASPSTAQPIRLIGVTGDGATAPETLFELDTTNASATFLMELGNGDDGETIAFDPVDELLYHASGLSNRIWESIDLDAVAIVTSGPFMGPAVTDENTAMVYSPATGRFLVCDHSNAFFDATLSGVATRIGTVPAVLKGLAFSGGTLYGAGQASGTLYKLDPSNGSVLSSVLVRLGGNPVSGMNGLAAHPSTGVLWGIFRLGADRRLGTVNPATGVVTSVGLLPDNFAGIAFVPEPSAISMFIAGAIAVALCRESRRPRASSHHKECQSSSPSTR